MRNASEAAVLIVIGALGGCVVLSFVHKVRDEASRIQCRNNLKQIGLAVANYHHTYNRFPPAAMKNETLLPDMRLSWLVEIVPFVESTDLYARMDREKGWDADQNRYSALAGMPVFLCPRQSHRTHDTTMAPTDFIGISGIGADAAALPQGNPKAGFFGYERKLALDDIKAHAGTTIAAMETSRATGSWTAAGLPTVRGLEPDGPSYLGIDGQFGGNHRRGVNVLFADASVRFLDSSIEPRVLEALVKIIDDGKPSPFEDR
jgi:prepilin-type processing-associated H-X9-DG protein